MAGLSQATHDVRLVWLEPDVGARLDFQAGQFAAVRFGALPPRDYSMANRPGERRLEFHIRAMSAAGASAYVAERLREGERAWVEGPLGSAHLRPAHRGPILALAGGTGLAPMQSIVETALARDPRRSVSLYFGVKAERDLYGLARFQALAERHAGFRFVPLLSEPGGPTAHRTGLLGDAVLADCPDLTDSKAYLAGPPAMVEAAVSRLSAAGLPEADIHADPFINEHEKKTD